MGDGQRAAAAQRVVVERLVWRIVDAVGGTRRLRSAAFALGSGTPSGLPPAQQFADLAALRAAWARLDPELRAFVLGLDAAALARPLTYRAFNGQEATLTFEQMLSHVVNHGSYHRGQLTTMLRQLGVPPPPSTDMVAFHRERAARRAQ